MQQNLEPCIYALFKYFRMFSKTLLFLDDVLFLSQQQQSKPLPHPSSTPDVALQSQYIAHRMRQSSAGRHYHRHHSQQSGQGGARMSNVSGGSSDQDSRKFNIKIVFEVIESFNCFLLSELGTVSRYRVSAKIQQLLNTLKKPKRRPLPEFYEDDDIELEMAARPKDPNAPVPEGSTMTPANGPQLVRIYNTGKGYNY